MVVRVVNFGNPVEIQFNFEDVTMPNSVAIAVLEGVTGEDYEENTPWEPLRISPKYSSSNYDSDTAFTLNTNSFTIFTFSGVVSRL